MRSLRCSLPVPSWSRPCPPTSGSWRPRHDRAFCRQGPRPPRPWTLQVLEAAAPWTGRERDGDPRRRTRAPAAGRRCRRTHGRRSAGPPGAAVGRRRRASTRRRCTRRAGPAPGRPRAAPAGTARRDVPPAAARAASRTSGCPRRATPAPPSTPSWRPTAIPTGSPRCSPTRLPRRWCCSTSWRGDRRSVRSSGPTARCGPRRRRPDRLAARPRTAGRRRRGHRRAAARGRRCTVAVAGCSPTCSRRRRRRRSPPMTRAGRPATAGAQAFDFVRRAEELLEAWCARRRPRSSRRAGSGCASCARAATQLDVEEWEAALRRRDGLRRRAARAERRPRRRLAADPGVRPLARRRRRRTAGRRSPRPGCVRPGSRASSAAGTTATRSLAALGPDLDRIAGPGGTRRASSTVLADAARPAPPLEPRHRVGACMDAAAAAAAGLRARARRVDVARGRAARGHRPGRAVAAGPRPARRVRRRAPSDAPGPAAARAARPRPAPGRPHRCRARPARPRARARAARSARRRRVDRRRDGLPVHPGVGPAGARRRARRRRPARAARARTRARRSRSRSPTWSTTSPAGTAIRVGAASAYVRCDDEAVLGELLADSARPRCGCAGSRPPCSPRRPPATGPRAAARARMGYAPAAESSDGTVVIRRPDARRTPPRQRPPRLASPSSGRRAPPCWGPPSAPCAPGDAGLPCPAGAVPSTAAAVECPAAHGAARPWPLCRRPSRRRGRLDRLRQRPRRRQRARRRPRASGRRLPHRVRPPAPTRSAPSRCTASPAWPPERRPRRSRGRGRPWAYG